MELWKTPDREQADDGSAVPAQSSEKEGAMAKEAILYRMILPEHTCPFGVRAKALLEQHDMQVDDRILSTREEVDAFEAEHKVETTPQIFIDGQRIGGCDDLEDYLAQAEATPSN
ncbi:glutaredoxin domain-containing protein [Sphingomonas sp. ASY06-1R]|uniref:glutaredoxin domain-containing protein n=1 Tax=Sphingomonas sp. ASY06-1R TaxID=3445771 RepID=UPI003FA1E6F3